MATATAKLADRIGLASLWTSSNPTLLAGERGVESDTKRFKIGDGSTAWTSLEYASSGEHGAEDTVASATTTDIGATVSENVSITGTTTITGLGTCAAGTKRWGRFTGALTLTHNGTSLILPGVANITTAAGDRFVAVSLGSGNWCVHSYTKANGEAVVGGAGGGGTASDVQAFTSDGTWTKPALAKTVAVIAWGAGGKGGGGSGGSAGTARVGGGGGGGGARNQQVFNADNLPATVAVVVGVGGTSNGAGGVSGSGTEGGAGTATTFGSFVYAGGGGGGGKGAIATASAGGGGGGTAGGGTTNTGSGTVAGGAPGGTTGTAIGGQGGQGAASNNGGQAEYGGGGGAGSTNILSNRYVGGSSMLGGGGGGSAGGVNTSDSRVRGRQGGLSGQYTSPTGESANTDGAAGDAGADASTTYASGAGGYGGTGHPSGTGGVGGAGGFPAGGGGGGGGGTSTGGDGGAGGNGYCIVITTF